MIGLSKEQQLAHHNRRKAAKQSSKAKGNELENEVAKAFNGRRNNQAKAGGGLSNPDASTIRGWHFEIKNTERLSVPEWLRTLKLVFAFEGEPWMTVRLGDRVNFAQDLIEHLGGSISF